MDLRQRSPGGGGIYPAEPSSDDPDGPISRRVSPSLETWDHYLDFITDALLHAAGRAPAVNPAFPRPSASDEEGLLDGDGLLEQEERRRGFRI